MGESRGEANHLKEGQFVKKVCWPLFRTTQATTEKERAGTGVGQRGELQSASLASRLPWQNLSSI